MYISSWLNFKKIQSNIQDEFFVLYADAKSEHSLVSWPIKLSFSSCTCDNASRHYDKGNDKTYLGFNQSFLYENKWKQNKILTVQPWFLPTTDLNRGTNFSRTISSSFLTWNMISSVYHCTSCRLFGTFQELAEGKGKIPCINLDCL